MINNVDKEIKLKANTKKVTIEIPTDMLMRIFNDYYGENDYKIKNKKNFRETFVEIIRDKLEDDVLDEIAEIMLDEEDCVKYIGE